ncbi:recombinase family protein [Flavobacterium amnicola]|uniref:Recombinase family protein n=1 Tax=Flavobacterium amnicola TaxID=2506422 RepID=A0A4Q1K0W9_9FLAO|nr:recombinase family protein [Flavobacterium amnicola]RXR17356.1 recombinase family protein [Flavobacterium amnicola]
MKARYVRVSTQSQNPARQLAKQHPDEKLFIDVCSGAIAFNHRPEGIELLNAVYNGEINYISVSSVDRLGRNAEHILTVINYLNAKKVVLKIDNLGIESFLPNGKENQVFKLITTVMSNISEMEREAIRERQQEGIAIAKAQGKFSGKRNKPSASDDEVLSKYKDVVKELKLGHNSLRKVATLGGVSLGTVQKVKAILDKQKQL